MHAASTKVSARSSSLLEEQDTYTQKRQGPPFTCSASVRAVCAADGRIHWLMRAAHPHADCCRKKVPMHRAGLKHSLTMRPCTI
eukprot:6185077-Pleurochrysis_carterae.AAC.2